MKKKLICLMLMIQFYANIAQASAHHVYFGVDAQLRKMNFKNGFGHNLFPHHGFQGNIYTGLKLSEFIGIELGYECLKTKSRTSTLHTGNVNLGAPISPGMGTVTFMSSVKVAGPHLNIVGYFPLSHQSPWSLIGSIGASFLKASFERRTLLWGTPSQVGTTVRKFVGKKTVMRASVGLQYQLTDQVALRTTLGWINTGRLIGCNQDELIRCSVKPKNTIVYSAGLSWSF